MTSGAHDDLTKVTAIARSMVTQWGMSEKLGPRTFGKRESMVFLGRDIAEQRDYSEKVAEQIDDEVRELVDRARDRARGILTQCREKLAALATVLMEKETLDGEQLQALLDWNPGEPLPTSAPPLPQQEPPPSTTPPGSGKEEDPVMPPKPGLVWGGNANYKASD